MFVTQKSAGLKSCIPQVNQVSLRLPLLLDAKSVVDKSAAIKTLILTSLWGNKADLSLWPALKDTTTTTNENKSNPSAYADTMSYVLDDHLDAVVNRLSDVSRSNSKVVSIVVDNAGYELVTDLLLGYGLIKLGIADKIVFHTKAHPTFVSDATTIDCVETINYLRTEEPCPAIVSIGSELYNMCQSNQIEFQDDVFWCQPIEFWNMPDSIIQKISNHKMVFVKGDANYRRLLGERTWSLDTPASTVLSYWPVPVCALRTFKAEIGCGISDKMVEKTQSSDEQWMVSGKWGVIQLGGPDIV